jgi:hypothetical protein
MQPSYTETIIARHRTSNTNTMELGMGHTEKSIAKDSWLSITSPCTEPSHRCYPALLHTAPANAMFDPHACLAFHPYTSPEDNFVTCQPPPKSQLHAPPYIPANFHPLACPACHRCAIPGDHFVTCQPPSTRSYEGQFRQPPPKSQLRECHSASS